MSEQEIPTGDEADPFAELREAALALGANISIVPPPPDPREAWRQRAADYNSGYLGPIHWAKFLNVLAATGSSSMAARQAGVTYQRVAQRRERYPEFARHFLEALEYFNSAVLERAAVIRAVDGIDEPVFHNGIVVGYKRRYSDVLAAKLLEGAYPDKYKQRTQVDVKTDQRIVIEGGFNEETRPAMIDVTPAAPQLEGPAPAPRDDADELS